MNDELHSQKTIHRKLFLFVLGFSVFSVWLITVTFQLSLIDIARTFHVNVGTAGLVAAVGSISGAVAGLLLSVLSVRLNHKLLLLVGLACTSLAAVGFFLASTFSLVLVPNIGVGAGIAIVTSMAYSLIGDFYPLEKRGRAIGCIVASSTLVYVIGGPIIGVLASIGGWRSTMIWFSLPTSLTCLILAYLIIPHKSKTNPIIQREPFFSGCKQAFLNRSAIAVLFVTMFSMAEGSVGFYAVSYFRSQFSITIEMGSFVMLVGNVLGAVGGVVSGLLVNKVGRKPLGTLSCLAAALVTLTFTFMPTFDLSWGLTVIRFWFSAMALTAGGSLVIEQLPKFRGTMMSLNSTFMNFGMLLASVSAEIVLNL
ncbi:MAG: MFS transporter, partial [Chloroflexi bacterium]|nr:MFS transporter [Chloroflexota bacterium]